MEPAQQVTPTEASGPRAGFFPRLGAALIDGVVLLIVIGIISAVIGALLNEALGAVIAVVVYLAYFGYLEGSPSGQTIGKKAFGIRVMDFRTGGPIGVGRALIRFVARILSSIPCYLGYFWMIWDREKQTWHDKLANTVVVPVATYPVEKWPG